MVELEAEEANTARRQTISRRCFLVILENHLNRDEFFLELLPRIFYACTQTTSGESNRATRNRR